jgi:hypothetical protein
MNDSFSDRAIRDFDSTLSSKTSNAKNSSSERIIFTVLKNHNKLKSEGSVMLHIKKRGKKSNETFMQFFWANSLIWRLSNWSWIKAFEWQTRRIPQAKRRFAGASCWTVIKREKSSSPFNVYCVPKQQKQQVRLD